MPRFRVEKSIEVAAPIERVHATVRDFESWPRWSPWLIVEPECRVEYDFDGEGYSWEGEVVGSGKMRVRECVENERIDYDLDFLKPWKSHADVSMRFSSAGEDDAPVTKVTWSMDSTLPVFLFWMKRMMVALIGMDYARGLAMLKAEIETGEVPSKLSFSTVSHAPVTFVGIRTRCDIPMLEASMEGDIQSLEEWLRSSGTKTAGKLRSFYHKWDVVAQAAEYSIGYPVEKVPDKIPRGMIVIEVPAIQSYAISHTGPYHHLGNAWSAGIMHGRAGRFKQRRGIHPFEIYEVRPGDASPTQASPTQASPTQASPTQASPDGLVTVVHFPIR